MQAGTWEDSSRIAWRVARPRPEEARTLAAAIGVSDRLAQLLLNRGIATAEEARAFLAPKLESLSDPFALSGLADAVARVRAAVASHEPTVVFGDYDVDGITGTALLVEFLRRLGADVRPYIPNRLEEGYGLSEESVDRLAEEGVRLIVTVDHGTTAVREIEHARGLGVDVVVVDHHQPGADRPNATALVNPHLGGVPEPYPCGVGVAFKLAWGIAVAAAGGPRAGGTRVAAAHRGFLTEALALVALGTVSDVVPLRRENRVYARFGLSVLGQSERPGLRALLEVSKVNGGTPTAGDVAYRLAPRLNAAGRLGRAELALELLLTDSPDRGREIAAILDTENRRRRAIEADIFDKAFALLGRDYEPGHRGGLVLGGDGWHAGVIGIVAARVVDACRRPTAIVAFDGELGRGSCRSIPQVSLPEALERCSEHLIGFGGHAAAAGFTIEKRRYPEFRRAFDRAVRDDLGDGELLRQLHVDAVVPLSEVTPELVREMSRLAPFGEGNPEPVLAARGVRAAGRPRRVGKGGDHLSFLASDGGITLKAIAFRKGPLIDLVEGRDRRVDLTFTPRIDEWRGDGSVELVVGDLTAGDD